MIHYVRLFNIYAIINVIEVIILSQVAVELSRSIKEGKWVSIHYHNLEDEDTFFWIAIKDVLSDGRKLKVDMFNAEKGMNCLEDKFIAFDAIIDAHVIEGTTCTIQNELISKIIKDYSSYKFLEFTGVNTRILQYYKACYQNDRSCTVSNYQLSPGLDVDVLQNQSFQLTEQKFEEVIKTLRLQVNNQKKIQQDIIRLGINVLGVMEREKLIPYVYRELLLNIKEKRFYIAEENSFNLLIDDNESNKNYRITNFLDVDIHDFIQNFDSQYNEYTENLASNLPPRMKVDERPYIFELHKKIMVNLDREYDKLAKKINDNTASLPISIFLGQANSEKKRKGKNILLLDSRINVNQIRVIFNALIKDVVYVQGPPGTGKTSTIINLIVSCFYNDQKVLICSNNNEAIENIYQKLKFSDFHFPILRLGSSKHIYNTLNQLHALLGKSFIVPDFDVNSMEMNISKANKNVQLILEKYEEYLDQSEKQDALKEIIEHINGYNDIDEFTKMMFTSGLDIDVQQTVSFNEDEFIKIQELALDKKEVLMYLHVKSNQRLSKLFTPRYKDLYDIIMLQDEDDRYHKFNSYLAKDQSLNDLLNIFPFIVSTNLGCYRLGTPSPNFDLVIMDEASQCSNAVSLLPLSRAKRMALVGDQNQLQPVICLSESYNTDLMNTYDIPSCYDYKHNSIMTSLLKVDALSKFILLKEHYRCAKDIINFANQKYYGNELVIRSKDTTASSLHFVDISSGESSKKNCCEEEVEAVLEITSKLPKDKSVAVITPFKSQAMRIQNELNLNCLNNIKVGTIHTFQGDEKDIILLSSGISQSTTSKTFGWLKNNRELINVATTRAKEKLILLSDQSVVEKLSGEENNDFLELVHYMAKNGNEEVLYKENELFNSKVKNYKYFNTQSEDIFLETLLHFKSIYGQVKVREKVKVSDALHLDTQEVELFRYGNQAHFDFLLYDMKMHPLLAIEVCGHEHYDNQKVILKDKMKKEICEKHDLKLLVIRNDYVRRYTYIKENILELLRK